MTRPSAPPFRHLAVIGAGAWGTALAVAAGRVTQPQALWLWAHEIAVATGINTRHANDPFLPGVELPSNVRATNDLAEAAGNADLLLIVVPAQHVRSVTTRLAGHVLPNVPADSVRQRHRT